MDGGYLGRDGDRRIQLDARLRGNAESSLGAHGIGQASAAVLRLEASIDTVSCGQLTRGTTAGVSDSVIVRQARPSEFDEVGQLTFQAYLADGMVRHADSYSAELLDAARR
ncbi:MAG: hypothetical protein ACRDSN_06725, partial [Pseudonocardiaceae bacterium]